MTSKRVPLALALSAVLFVTSGFAATKKIQPKDGPGDWNDWSFRTASLLNTGSVSSDGSADWPSNGGPSGPPLPYPANNPDDWNGGTGNWSNAGSWSAGSPGPSSDVTIYSGGNDLVTLDAGSTTINSLTLGGTYKGYTSELTDGGVKQTLTITNALNVGQTGILNLTGGSTVSAGADSSNAGYIDLESASTLGIAGNFTNTGVVRTGSSAGGNKLNITGTLTNSSTFELDGAGDVANVGMLNNTPSMYLALVILEPGTTLNLTNQPNGITDIVAGSELEIGGTFNAGANNGLYRLTSIEGSLILFGGQTTNVTPMGGALNISVDGYVNVELGSTLQINGNVNNSFVLATYPFGGIGGNVIDITGTLTNQGGGFFALISPGDAASLGSLTNFGQVDVESASTLQITGGASNFGTIGTNLNGYGGGNTIGIAGMLTNEAGGQFIINGSNDASTLGGLANSGYVDVGNGSTLQINGDASNSGSLGTGLIGGGGNKLTIMGTLVNNGTFELFGSGDMATIAGNLTNAGIFFIGPGSGDVATVGGNLTNSGAFELLSSGDKTTIGGSVTNEATGQFILSGPTDLATLGSLTNSGYVDVEGASTLQINGSVTNAMGVVLVDGGSTLQVNGDFSNTGLFVTGRFGGEGNTVNITGMLNNSGNFTVEGAGDVGTIGNGLSNVGGFVDVEHGSTLMITGDATNAGSLETNFNGRGGGNTIAITGLLTNTQTGQIDLNGPGDVLKALAGLSNSGVINVNGGSSIDPPFVNNLGTINIRSVSRLVVGTPAPMGGTGYVQRANGTLGEMISANTFGVINVNGSALLDGTLAILLQGGFNPSVGSTYKFLNFTPDMLSGEFANVDNDIFNNGTEQWCVVYQNNDGDVELIAEKPGCGPPPPPVSEPATLLVLIPGLLGVGYGLRRRLLK